MVGIGGSATNDAGFGLARKLGWTFLDRSGTELRQWTDLASCTDVLPPQQRLNLGRVTVAVDVNNPLLGPRGCTRVYGPQKGMRPQDFARAERNLRRLARLMAQSSGAALHQVPGAGAAGGLGFGLMAFLDARTASGFELFSRLSKLRTRIRHADLVITGEGCLDTQSLMGKGSGNVAALCREAGRPCIALVGTHKLRSKTSAGFASIHTLAPHFLSEQEALRQPGLHLRRLAAHIAANTLWT